MRPAEAYLQSSHHLIHVLSGEEDTITSSMASCGRKSKSLGNNGAPTPVLPSTSNTLLLGTSATKLISSGRPAAAGFSSKRDETRTFHLSVGCFVHLHLLDWNSSHNGI